MTNTLHASNRRCQPLAIAVAIALALGTCGIAQAQQYNYPGTASSSGNVARANAREAMTNFHDRYLTPQRLNGNRTVNERQRAAQRGYPSQSGSPYSYANGTVHPVRAIEPSGGVRERAQSPNGRHGANVSMQRGEACPIGECGRQAPSTPAGNPRGSYANGTVTPVRAMPANAHLANGAHVRPAEGYGRVAPTTGQPQTGTGTVAGAQAYTYPGSTSSRHSADRGAEPSRSYDGVGGDSNIRPSVGQSRTGVGSQSRQMGNAFTHAHGQSNKGIVGPGGQATNIGGSKNIVGPDGKPIHTGNASNDFNSFGNAAGTQTGRGGGSQVHLDNGGVAGAADSAAELIKEYNPLSDGNGTTTSDKGTLQWKDGKKWSGTDSDGLTWNRGRPWNGKDGSGGIYQNGHHIKGSTTSGVGDDPDIGGGRGGGTLVSGTGKGVNPGHRPGQDTGGGSRPDGTDNGGGSQRNNATGAYVVTHKNGQDLPVKPKETGVLRQSYNGVKGVTDPKKGGNSGGGG